MWLFLVVVLAAVVFEYTNGFHDAANAIATVVSTKVLTPRQAIAMAAFFNLTGALLGGAVATTVGKGLVDTQVVTMGTVLSAVLAGFIWNMITWFFGLPSSSSHALIGGLCGAAVATAKGNWSVIKWHEGLWPKVIVPMITSPVAGFVLGGLVMFLLFVILHKLTPFFIHKFFGKAQILSAAWMAHSHGTNDAQKTMGIITLALFTGTQAASIRSPAADAAVLAYAGVYHAALGKDFVRFHDGSRHCRRRLANHSHAWPSSCPSAAGQRFRRRNQRGVDHSSREPLRNSAFHHARHLNVDHGRRRGETFQRHAVDRGRTHRLGLDFHSARDRRDRLPL